MNRGTMRTQTAAFLGDQDQTRHTEAQYNTALDRAQEQFALDTKALWKDATVSTVSGTAEYALSGFTPVATDFMWEDTLTYDGYELTPISRHELNRLNPGRDWSADTGKPSHFIIDPEEANKSVTLYPIPQEVKTVSMRYYPLPASMSDDSDLPMNSSALMAQFHMAICAFAAWILLLGETITPEIGQKRRELLALYNDGTDKAVSTFKNTASQPIKMRGGIIWR